jgi:hypothetical protein
LRCDRLVACALSSIGAATPVLPRKPPAAARLA